MECIFIYHLPFSCLCTLLKPISFINLVTLSIVLKNIVGGKAARALLKGESGNVKRSVFKLPSKLCSILSSGTGENHPQVVICPTWRICSTWRINCSSV